MGKYYLKLSGLQKWLLTYPPSLYAHTTLHIKEVLISKPQSSTVLSVSLDYSNHHQDNASLRACVSSFIHGSYRDP